MFAKQSTLLLLGLLCCSAAGCSMCCGVYDYMYPTFGGKYERVDPEYGRVGSIYSDPMADPGTEALTNEDVPAEPSLRRPIEIDESDDGIEAAPDPDNGSGLRETETTRRRINGRWR